MTHYFKIVFLTLLWLPQPAAASDEGGACRLVFLLIGQSNMAGRAPVGPDDRVTDPRILTLTRDWRWVPAQDPLHWDKPALAGTGPGLTFARSLAKARLHCTIALVPAAMGGSALSEWGPRGILYANAISRTKFALRNGRLAGILWHQGESDEKPELARTYRDRFARFAARLRADLDPEAQVPIIIGETGRFRPEHAAINAVLAALPPFVPRCTFVSSEGLTDKGDRLHFDQASAHELGRRYAEAWLRLAGAH